MIPFIEGAWHSQTCRDRKLEWWLLGAGGGRNGELFNEADFVLQDEELSGDGWG